jgi:selenocysteine lyase/cysteine desulfurase
MTAPENIIGSRKEVERLHAWGTVLRNRIARDEHELWMVEKAKAGHVEFLELLKEAARKAGRRRVTLDDIKDCDTQREVLRYVADAGFGLAHLGEVADLVKDARMSKAEKDSIRSTLHHYVNDSDDFVHIGKSWVWRKDFGPAPTLEEVEAA